METKHEEASHMGIISCFLFPLFSSGLDTRLDPLEELDRWHIQQKPERNLIYLVKGLEKGTLPSTQGGRSKGILDTVCKEVQVPVTSHVHETDPRKHSQGLKDFIDIVT